MNSQNAELSSFGPRAASLLCLGSIVAALTLSGCATGPGANPRDPLEPFNRGVFSFNEGLDRAVLKPVATAYQEVIPQPAQTAVSNFFSNLGDAWSAVNNALQGKGLEASESFGRLLLNSTFGIAGIFDLATPAGISKHPQDFGQTLGRWGVSSGPYIVLPLLGPSTFRDTAALPLDFKGDLAAQVSNVPTRNSLVGLRAVSGRSQLLGAGKLLDEATLDKYSFLRDAHLQRRDASILSSEDRERQEGADARDQGEVLRGAESSAIKATPASR